MASKKKAIIITVVVIAVIFLILIITPFFINADRFRPQIEAALGEKLGRTVQIGHLNVSLFSGSLQADQISISDDPAYSKGAFLAAKSLAVGIDVMPLIFSRDLRVHSLEFKDPQVNLLRSAAGQWNFSTLAATPAAKIDAAPKPQTAPADAAGLNNFTVDKLKISNGTIAFGRAGQTTRLAYQDVNITANNISQTAAFPFTFDAKTPGNGKLNLAGSVGPIGIGDAEKMPFDGQLKASGVPAEDVENLLAVLGYALPTGSSLKGGTIQANLALHGPLESLVTQGPVQLNNVTLAGFSLASKLAGALGQTGNTSNDTVIKLASSKLRYAAEGVRADSVDVVIPMIGSVTGAGTVSSNNSLSFKLLAKLDGSSPLAQLTKLPFFSQSGGLPFRIEGTTSNPRVIPDVAGFGGLGKTPLNQLKVPDKNSLGGIIGGLLKKKKP